MKLFPLVSPPSGGLPTKLPAVMEELPTTSPDESTVLALRNNCFFCLENFLPAGQRETCLYQ